MGEYIGGQFPESQPDQFLTNVPPDCRAHRRYDDHGPSPGPLSTGRAVDAQGGLRKSVATVLRQTVLAEFSGAASLEPTVLLEACCCGAHQPFIQPERPRQRDQAAQCDGAA